MAQTVLTKTTREAKETFPAAAKVIKDNINMDNIYDSVPSVKEAKKLTTDLDSVLETGGFQVKGWVSNRTETENQLIKGELRRNKHAVHLVFEGDKGQLPQDCKMFSSWKRLVHVTTYTSTLVWNLHDWTT